VLRRVGVARASVLAVLMLWFATHHIAPNLGMRLHSHQDPTLQWTTPHTHAQHCEFCSAAGYLGIWVVGVLPRAPQELARATKVLVFEATLLGYGAQARAPPYRW
jgi:hypothetical protein